MSASAVHSPASFTSLELTGRATTHVREAPALGTRLHAEAIGPVLELREAARADGIDLVVVSGFRDFVRQSAIWNGKFRGERPLLDRQGRPLDAAALDEAARVEAILLWSALPGASRHHWGTDFDVIDRAAVPDDYRPQLTVEEFTGSGPFARLNDWLAVHLKRFGFFRPYITDRGGVHPEPWHVSYAPLATRALEQLSLDVLHEAVEQGDLLGRDHILARLPEIHARYVMAIDPA
ncbi:MAG: M15 family metallopeptidase [Steroidobacteraceae bacterium]|nr:M15 family metallopeptidase [Steroidobacteraceae bacterium]